MKKFLPAVAAVLLASCLPVAAAQRLNVPNYLLTTLPILESGSTISGSLTTADGQNFKDGSYLHVYAFRGNAGEDAFLTVGSDEFDTYLTVYDPAGQLLDLNDDDWYDAPLGHYFNSSLQLTLPDTGRYTVVVSGYSNWDVGAYELRLILGDSPAAAGAGPLFTDALPLQVPGTSVVSIDSSLPATGEGFQGPGQLFAFSTADDLFMRFWAGHDEVDTVLLLYAEDGTLLDWNDDHYPTATETSSAYWQSQISIDLPAGSYYLVVGSYSDWYAGDVDLEVTAYLKLD